MKKEITGEELNNMKLHDVLATSSLSILRVSGGWIYRDERAESAPVNTFVPYDNQLLS